MKRAGTRNIGFFFFLLGLKWKMVNSEINLSNFFCNKFYNFVKKIS